MNPTWTCWGVEFAGHDSVGRAIWAAANDGEHCALEGLLADPGLTEAEVNFYYGGNRDTPLIRAVICRCERSVRVLLAHPLTLVNAGDNFRWTALHHAVTSGSGGDGVIHGLLCAHPGVRFDVLDVDNTSPLWNASYRNHPESVRRLLAYAPDALADLQLQARDHTRSAFSVRVNWHGKRALEVAGCVEIRELLTRYEADPRETRRLLRLELGLLGADIAADFASAVLLCDGYLSLRSHDTGVPAARLLMMIARLPLELQMMLCHRRHGSARGVILARDTEMALLTTLNCLDSLPSSRAQ